MATAIRSVARRLRNKTLLPMCSSASELHSHVTSFGDVAFRIRERLNSVKHRALQDFLDDNLDETKVYVCDINPNMLNVGRKRAQERGLGDNKSLASVEGDVEALKFDNISMDGYPIAFGFRNVIHIEKALAETYR